jgi:hypothetical protein
MKRAFARLPAGLLAPLLLAAALAACSRTPEPASAAPAAPAPGPAPAAATAPAATAEPAVTAEPAATAEPQAAAEGAGELEPLVEPNTRKFPVAPGEYLLPFTLNPDQGRSNDPRILQWRTHPCGATPYALVRTIPIGDRLLLSDEVIEYDAAGEAVRSWHKPFEAEVIAVDGERLGVRVSDGNDVEQALWVDVFGVLAPAKAFAAGEPRPLDRCPKLKAFEDSDYEQCYQYTDAAGGKRLLAYAGPCTCARARPRAPPHPILGAARAASVSWTPPC